ncbi:hypothetical protein AB6U14_17675 [Klebsiella pneumoniae]
MKKINHWINGKNVVDADYFHTTNPATRMRYWRKSPPAVKPK